MGSDVTVYLEEGSLKTDAIVLRAAGISDEDMKDVEQYERDDDTTGVFIEILRSSGEVATVTLEGFRDNTETAIKALRDNPLPWVFTLESLGIREKPLEDVLLAVWKKFRGIRMEWE